MMTNHRFSLRLMVLAALTAVPALAGEITFVKDGVSHTRIQMHRRASHLENRAADELRQTLVKMAGVDVFKYITPGVELLGTKAADTEILLVTEQYGKDILPRKALEKLAATKNPEAFVICTREDRGSGAALCIAGKTPIAVYYGVYAFMEDCLGCGFYHVDKDGTVIPKAKTISVPDDIFDFREPWVKTRRVSTWMGNVKPFDLKDVFSWQAKRGFNWEFEQYALWGTKYFTGDELTQSQLASLPFGGCSETITTMVVPGSMFKEHPEYFPLVKGQRKAGGYPARRCFSNPDVLKAWVDYGVSYHDYGGYIKLGMTDIPGDWCECEKCRAFGCGRDGKWTSENYAHRFFGEVAKGILERRPDAKIFIPEYLTWRKIPTCDFTHDDRVTGEYCPHGRCYVHALNDPNAPCNRAFHQLYLDWLKYYPRHGFFEYYCYGFTEYAPIEYVFGHDMKYYHEHGMDNFIEDASNGSIVTPYIINDWQFYYIYSKMCWNPDLDVEKEMDKVYRRYYGKAVEPMLKYHVLRRDLWENSPGHNGMGATERHGLCLMRPGACEQMEGFLKEAAALAKGDEMLVSRVARDRRCFEGIWVKRWENAKKKIATRGAVSAVRVEDGAIKVDGTPDAAWTAVKPLDGIVTGKGVPGKFATVVRLAYDSANWYVAVEAKGANPVAAIETHDGAVWEDDCVEIAFSNPKGDYCHMIVNAAGTLYDACGQGLAFDLVKAGGEAKVVKVADGYTVELKLPFAAAGFASVKPGDDWGFYLSRTAFQDASNPDSRESVRLGKAGAHDPVGYPRVAFGE